MQPLVTLTDPALLLWLPLDAVLSEEASWTLTDLFGGLSLYLIIGNPIAAFVARRHKKNYSWVPFLGGVFGALSLLFCPIHEARYFAWMPLLLDLTIPMFLYAVFVLKVFRSK